MFLPLSIQEFIFLFWRDIEWIIYINLQQFDQNIYKYFVIYVLNQFFKTNIFSWFNYNNVEHKIYTFPQIFDFERKEIYRYDN